METIDINKEEYLVNKHLTYTFKIYKLVFSFRCKNKMKKQVFVALIMEEFI